MQTRNDTFKDVRIAGGDTAVPMAMAKRLDTIGPFLEGKDGRFLDCGCGAGSYVAAIRNRFQLDVHGIEHDQGKVRSAQEKLGLEGRVQQGDLQALDQPDNSWDFALLNEVLEHVPNDRAALSEVFRVLRPGGMLFLFSPNRWFPFETHGVYWRASDRPVPYWIPFIPYLPLPVGQRFFRYWARNYWPSELVGMSMDTGFRIVKTAYIGLTFENISGRQPLALRITKPFLRQLSNGLEHCPGLRRLGVSQFIACQKPTAIKDR
jgi:ubiquinone/menaquinone biosynthesis C-methylase UbiE